MATLTELATKVEKLETMVQNMNDVPSERAVIKLQIDSEEYDLTSLDQGLLVSKVIDLLSNEIKATKKEIAAIL